MPARSLFRTLLSLPVGVFAGTLLLVGCSEETGEKTGDAAKKTGEAIVSGVDDAAKATSKAADELDEEIED